MDVISDVLSHIPVSGPTSRLVDMHGEFAFAAPQSDGAAFYLASRGSVIVCYHDKTVQLDRGDIIFFPRGSAHTIATIPEGLTISASERDEKMRRIQSSDRVANDVVQFASDRPQTSLINGRFTFGRSSKTHLSGLFPNHIILRRTSNETATWLDPLIRRLVQEARSELPGAAAALNGVFKMQFVQLMRSWINAAPDGTLGWIEALRDQQVGKSIRLIHASPARNWSVQGLASEVFSVVK